MHMNRVSLKYLLDLVSETGKLLNRATSNGDWHSYKKTTEYNKEIRKVKRNRFRKLCEEIDSTPTVTQHNMQSYT